MHKHKLMIIRYIAIAILAIATGLTLFGPEPQAQAAALTDARPTQSLTGESFPAVLGATEVFRGGLAAVSNGYATAAANNTNLYVVGVFGESVDNTSDAADYSATRRVAINRGIFRFDNHATIRLLASDVGKPCYVIDDQTVGCATNGYSVAAGTVVYVEPDLATVWVDVGKIWRPESAPHILPASSSGLASGRLWRGTVTGVTNAVFVVP